MRPLAAVPLHLLSLDYLRREDLIDRHRGVTGGERLDLAPVVTV